MRAKGQGAGFAPLLIVSAGILWGSMGLFVRRLNGLGLASMEIVALRSVVTAVLMLLFLLCFDRRLLQIKWKDIWCFFGTGICSILFFNFCYFKAMELTSLSVAAILLYTAPAIVMLLSYFLFREKLTGRKILSVLMTFAGCVLVTGILTEGGAVSAAGILMGLGAGLGYALYSIFSRYALEKGYHTFTITFYTFLIASIGSFFLADMGKVVQTAAKDAGTMLLCLGLGIVCTVIPYLTYTLGLKYVENGKASILASIEPVTATLLGGIVFHERLTAGSAAGVILVLTALYIASAENREKGTQS
ncbi:MAG: DMT family transporter [Agathobacter sp.]